MALTAKTLSVAAALFALVVACAFATTEQVPSLAPLLQNPPVTFESGSYAPFNLRADVLTAIGAGNHSATDVLVTFNGSASTYRLVAGFRVVETREAATPATIYRLASASKLVTALTVLQAADRGRFTLDDRVAEYIRGFADARVLRVATPTRYAFTSVAVAEGSSLLTVALPGLSASTLAGMHRQRAGVQLAAPLAGVSAEGIATIVSVSPAAGTVTLNLECAPTLIGQVAANGTLDVLDRLPVRWTPYEYVDAPYTPTNPALKQRFYYSTEPSRPVTLRHLLTHTAGFAYVSPFASPFDQGALQSAIVAKVDPALAKWQLTPTLDMDAVEWAERLARIPMLFQPGTQWVYGPQVGLAGAVLLAAERAQPCASATLSLYEVQKRLLFDPLGITDAGYFILDADARRDVKIANLAHAYVRFDGSLAVPLFSSLTNGADFLMPGYNARFMDGVSPSAEGFGNLQHPVYGAAAPRRFEAGDAGLYMRADELHRIVTLIAQNGSYNGQQVVRAETIRAMVSNQIGDLFIFHPLGFLGTRKWGFGVAVADGSVSGPFPKDRTTAQWSGALGAWWFADQPSRSAFALLDSVLAAGDGTYEATVNQVAASVLLP